MFDRFSERIEGFLDEVFIPERLRSRLARASRLMEREKYDQALDLLQSAESDHDEHHRTFHLLGLCHFFREENEEALEALERAVALREEPISHFYAGRTAERLGAYRDAKLHFQKALTASQTPPFEFELHFGLGRVLLGLDRPEKAVHELEKAEELSPGKPEVATTLARALADAGRNAEAAELLEELAEEDLPVEALVLQGRLAESEGEHGRAAARFERALEVAPESLDSRLGAARSLLRVGDTARSRQYLLYVLDAAEDPDDRLEARVLLGRAHEKVGDLDEAKSQYETALETTEARPANDRRLERRQEAQLGAARLALETGDQNEAAASFEELLTARNDGIRREARLGLARCRLEQGDATEARRLLDETDDSEAPAKFRAERLLLAGRAAFETGDAAEALVAFQEALVASDRPAIRRRLERARVRALEALQPDWNLPERLDGPVAIERTLDQMRSFLASAHELERFVPEARELSEAMGRPLSVAIVGEFNAGKSTLVNALVGEEVVPTGVLPTTAHTCYIRYGPRKTARVHYRERADDVVEVNFEEARRRMEEDADAIDHLEFLYPHPQLRSIHFWDTPGFNAAEGEHDKIASSALEEAEAILWVFDAKQTLSRTEFDRLNAIPDGADRTIVLLNKRDALDEDELEELEAYVDENLGATVAGQFAISARNALERITNREEGRDGENGEGDAPRFADFRDFLDSRFVQRAGRIKTLEVRRRLAELVDALRAHVEELLARYDRLEDRADALRAWVEEQAESRPAERTEREARTVEDQFDFARTAVAREIREDLRPRGTFFSRMVLDEQDREFALRVFEDRLGDILERSRTRVEDDIAAFENDLDLRLGPILDALSVPNARSLNRRLEGLHDEFNALKLLLGERVYGHLRARIHGRIDAAGDEILRDIEPGDPEDLEPWRTPLGQLLPDASDHIDEHLSDWYREFSLAAYRFSDRVHRDLQLLRLEAEYRFDSTPLQELLETP